MNIPLSLLIYNPLEAYTLILLCDIISGNNTTMKFNDVYKLYLFGCVSLMVQLIPYLWYDEITYLILNIFVAYMIMPILLKNFYTIITGKTLKIRQCFVAMFIHCIFAIVVPIISDMLFKTNTLFYNNDNLHEFIINFIIFFMQIIPYKLIEKEGYYYEKSRKRNCRKSNR